MAREGRTVRGKALACAWEVLIEIANSPLVVLIICGGTRFDDEFSVVPSAPILLASPRPHWQWHSDIAFQGADLRRSHPMFRPPVLATISTPRGGSMSSHIAGFNGLSGFIWRDQWGPTESGGV
jgi:hypothetical protein